MQISVTKQEKKTQSEETRTGTKMPEERSLLNELVNRRRKEKRSWET
jgi:hypothetical protein